MISFYYLKESKKKKIFCMVKYFLNIILFLNVEILLFMYKFKNLDIKLEVVYIL